MRGGGGLSGRDRVLAVAVPVVVALLASVAVERHHRVDQSPWQGFGLGMFSTVEHRNARTIRATGSIDGEEQPVQVPGELSRLASRVLAAPGDEQMQELAHELRDHAGADQLVVEVWGYDVDARDEHLVIGFRVLRRVEVP